VFLAVSSSPACDRAAYYLANGDWARALKQLDGVRAKGNTNAANENMRGLALMLAGKLKESIDVFDSVMKADPSMIEARFNRAVALLKLCDNAKASAEFEKIAFDEHNMLRATAAYHNALAYDRMGRTKDAMLWVDRSIALDNDFDSALLLAGALRERTGQVEAAARSYLTYLKRHPDSPSALLRLGICAQRANRIDVAKTYLKKVIAVAPDSADAAEARKFLVMWE